MIDSLSFGRHVHSWDESCVKGYVGCCRLREFSLCSQPELLIRALPKRRLLHNDDARLHMRMCQRLGRKAMSVCVLLRPLTWFYTHRWTQIELRNLIHITFIVYHSLLAFRFHYRKQVDNRLHDTPPFLRVINV